MKIRILGLALLLLIVSSCQKEQLKKENQQDESIEQKNFYYQGSWYQVNYKDGMALDSKEKDFIESIFSEGHNLVVDYMVGEPDNVYLMESDYQFYELFPEKFPEGVSTKIMFNIALDELKDELTSTFGNVFYNNDSDFLLELEVKLNEICTKYEMPMPNDLYDFFKQERNNAPAVGGTVQTRWNIAKMYEGSYYGGSATPINPFDYGTSETSGDYNCFEDIKVPYLSNIPMSTGGDWNNAISSGWFRINEGADATVFWCYKKSSFKGYKEKFNTSNVFKYIGSPYYIVSTFSDHHWCWFCTSLNDTISSMKAHNIWQGC